MTTYRGIEISPKLAATKAQARNLIDLAAVLREVPPPKFDMSDFAVTTSSKAETFLSAHPKLKIASGSLNPRETLKLAAIDEKNICGTSCCAVGTAAFRGIGKPKEYHNFFDYAVGAFAAHEWSVRFDWLFGCSWDSYDNRPLGAAARILYLVETGDAPPNFRSPDSRWKPAYAKYRRHAIEAKP